MHQLGLRKGLVEIVPHDPAWLQLFREERSMLRQHIGDHAVAIEHVGSTAVPGLLAKPILDIAVAVPSIAKIPDCRAPLLAMGYIDEGDLGADGGYLFVRERAPGIRTHHLHIVAIDDSQWPAYLGFRDLLIADDEARAAYASLKVALAQDFGGDRQSYTLGKHDFVRACHDPGLPDRQQ